MDALEQLKSSLANRYDIRREIGRGGMATVYLAHDVRHDRNVALKLLNPELGAVLGGERFLSEIRVTANLQHPNLLPLFDSGGANGLLYYVMPFVEGESLRARLTREKQLPVDEAVRIASSIASALDYAHAHGVIHRDLKPENILLQAGQPVLADFGIALAVANAGGVRITQTGLSLGSPQYMSPEQATGDRVIDGRTDIYSLGVVLYEMLTGDPPHTGSTAQAIIARVLTDKPRSVRASRETVSPHVEAAVERALAKLPADRFANARAFAEALEGSRTAAQFAAAAGPLQETRRALAVPLAKLGLAARRTIITMIVAAGVWGWIRPIGAPAPRARFTLELSDSARLREAPGSNVALAPDGSQFVYVGGLGTTRLHVRRLNELSAVPIPGTERASSPRFSPDGAWLAYTVSGQLRKIPLAGGPAVTIAADSVARAAWGDGDVIVFGRTGSGTGPLYRVSAAGGPVARVTTLDTTRGETGHTWPDVLPGGKAIVFTIQRGTAAVSELAAARLDDGKPVYLGIPAVNPRYVRTGHIVFGRPDDGSVLAVPFDARRLQVTGPAVTVLEGVVVKPSGGTEVAISRNGTLAYVEGGVRNRIVSIDRSGVSRVLLDTPQLYLTPRVSPDGQRIAFTVLESGAKQDIWVYSLSGTLTRLTRNGASSQPAWTSDGRRIAWIFADSAEESTRWQPWDGSGAPEPMAPAGSGLRIADFSRGGTSFVMTKPAPGGGASDVWSGSLGTPRVFRQLLTSPAAEWAPKISPDGRWVAYSSDESGSGEVFVTSMLNPARRHQISTNGGFEPVWAADGKTLFYRAAGRMMAATVVTAPEFVVQRRDTLFVDGFDAGRIAAMYDVFPGGKEFVMLQSGAERQRAVVVFGWLDELRERMAMAGNAR